MALRLCACHTLFSMANWPAHQAQCAHWPVPCSWCKVPTPRRELDRHHRDHCANILKKCPDCPFTGVRSAVASHPCDVRRLREQLAMERTMHLALVNRLRPPRTTALASELPMDMLIRTPADLGNMWRRRLGDCMFRALVRKDRADEVAFRVPRSHAVLDQYNGRYQLDACTSGDERVFIMWPPHLNGRKFERSESDYKVEMELENPHSDRNCFFRAHRLPGSGDHFELALTCELWTTLTLGFRSLADATQICKANFH